MAADANLVGVTPDGARRPTTREWVPEAPVALEFNGVTYAVMMATPADLDDFVLGFALNEGLAVSPADLGPVDVAEVPEGWIARATLAGPGADRISDRVRARAAGLSLWVLGRSDSVLLANAAGQ